jgi:hypothetical protein
MHLEELPPIDQHGVAVAAPPDAVWDAVLSTLGGLFTAAPARATARLLGCDPPSASRWEQAEVGSSVPAFRIVAADRPRLLVVAGRHRFSRYGIVFRVEPAGTGARCTAESRATFPGLLGAAYGLAVVGSGGHVVAVRRMLRSIARTAEAASAGTPDPVE